MKKIMMSGFLFLLAMSLVCALPTITTKQSPLIKLDLNQDGSINRMDVYILLGFMGQKGDNFIIKNPDLNDDNKVDLSDLSQVISDYGPCGSNFCDSDLNRDYVVNQQDVYIIYGFYNMKPNDILSPDVNGDCSVDLIDLAEMLQYT